jgi:hypothetical protein
MVETNETPHLLLHNERAHSSSFSANNRFFPYNQTRNWTTSLKIHSVSLQPWNPIKASFSSLTTIASTMFLTMQRWFWQSKSVSLYIIEIWVWLFGWWLVREQLCCAHLITWNVADSRWTWLCNSLLNKSGTLYFTLLLCFYFALLFYQFDARVFNFSASFYMHIPLNTNNWFLCYQI